MDKIKKDEIKKKAANLAAYLGYNINSINLDVINVQEAYCQGYSQALEDTPQLFPMDKWIEFKNVLLGELMSTEVCRQDIIDKLQELESFGKPAGEAKELK